MARSHQFSGGSHAEFLAHDRRGIGDCLVGECTSQAISDRLFPALSSLRISISRAQFRQRALGSAGRRMRCFARSRAAVDRRLSDLADRFDQILGIAGLGDIALGADLDRARRVDRIVVHAEHDDARRGSRARIRRASSKPDTVGRLMSITQMSGRSARKTSLAAFGVGCFQQDDLGLVGEHGPAAGSDDRMIIDDQNAHGIGPVCSLRCCAASDAMTSRRKSQSAHATSAILRYASIR